MTSADDREDRTPQPPGLAGSAMALLSREAARMPLVAVTLGLQAWERTRGMREMALRRGGEALQIAAHTPLGRFLPQPVFDDGAQAEAEEIAASVAPAGATTSDTAGTATKTAGAKPAAKTGSTRTATTKSSPGTAAAAKTATKKATPNAAAKAIERAAPTRPPAEAVAAGAPGVATEQVERVTEQLDLDVPASREDLPIPDFDNISIGSLRARLRSLDLDQLVLLREWEQAHAHRLPVITLLDNRIAKVADQQPSGSPAAYPAERARRAAQDEGGTLRI
ncbi:MAG TPA: hypothetical protein VFT62_05365 [Mycobacteriales bacterium]|nr:hypothetical protein [Mycobacteriales bacterium]